MAKRRANNDWTVTKLIVMLLVILVVVLLIGSMSNKSYVDVTDQVSADVIKNDGSTKHYDSSAFELMNKNDKINIYVDLPLEEKVEDGVMCFYIYHSVLNVYYGDELLYSYGQAIADKGDMIGVQFVEVPLPDEAWGSSITIQGETYEENSFSRLSSVRIYPSMQAYRFFIDDNELSIILSLVGIVLSLIVISISFVTKKKGKSIKRPIYIALFAFVVCTYLFTQHGSYKLFSDAHYWSDIEFFSLFVCGVPLLGYMFENENEKSLRIVILIAEIINIIFVATSTILHFSNVVHFSDTLVYSHIVLVADALLLSAITTHHLRENKPSSRILMVGFLLLVFFSVTDIIRFNITKYLPVMNMNVPSIIPIGILIFIVTLGLSYYEDIVADREHSNDLQQQLALQLEHYRGVEEKNSEISTYRHDMKNHLVVIDTLIKEGNNEKALAYLSELNVALNNKGNLIDTKNPILDAILTQKKETAASKGIKFVDDVHIAPYLKIDPLDVCKIFGNLLDNALEACVAEKGDAEISVQLTMRGQSLVAKIDNTSSTQPREDNQEGYVTHKQDKANHGYGIKSVRESVAKYDGVVNFTWKDKRFYALVMLQDVVDKDPA